MKSLHGAVVAMALSTLALTACQEAREDIANPLSESELYKAIGEEIPFETGMKWISHYVKRNAQQGRVENSSYHIPLAELNAMLESSEDFTGVAFHYGLDDLGQRHMLAIPVSSSLSLWPVATSQMIIDANTGSAIEQEQAFAWAKNFQTAHPAEIWFHFFGKNVFDEIKALPYLHGLDLQPAISTETDKPQLLLIIWNDESPENGRTQSQMATVYDASNACPPCAVQ